MRAIVFALVMLSSLSSERGYGDSPLTDRVRDKVKTYVQEFLQGQGIDLDWQQIKLSVSPTSLTQFTLKANAKKTTIGVKEIGLTASITELDIQMKGSFGLSEGIKIAEIGALKIIVSKIVMKEQKKKDPATPFLELPEWPARFPIPEILAEAKFSGIQVLIQSAELAGDVGIKATIEQSADDELKVTIDAAAKDRFSFSGKGNLMLKRKGGKIHGLSFNPDIALVADGTSIHGPIKLKLRDEVTLVSRPIVKMTDGTVTGELNLKWRKTHVAGNVSISIPAQMSNDWIEVKNDCQLAASWQGVSSQKLVIRSSCVHDGMVFEKSMQEFAVHETLNSKTRLSLKEVNGINPHFVMKAEIRSQKSKSKIAALKLSQDLTISGRALDAKESFEIAAKGDLAVAIREFQTAVTALKDTSIAVPASLNRLSGPIQLDFHFQTDSGKKRSARARLSLLAGLTSKEQILKIAGDGSMIVDNYFVPKKVTVNSEVKLQEIVLRLPYFSLDYQPNLTLDSRISKGPETIEVKEASPSGTDFVYDVGFATEKPIIVHSNLVTEPVPIGIKGRLKSDAPPEISVNVGEFTTELFRRSANLKAFSYKLRDDQEGGDIEGKIGIDYGGYEIFVGLKGTVKHPVVSLTSEPPLDERSLYSVLLYGRPLSEIEPESAENVSTISSEAAAGAIGLASLYLLAKSPIESVYYNPDTGTVATSVSLGAAGSLAVSRLKGNTSRVGVHRRVYGNWFVKTYVERLDNSAHNRVATFLEWTTFY